MLAVLFDVLELQPYPTVRAELISILESFLPYLLGAGDFLAVAYVLREVRAILQRARELLPEQRKTLEELPALKAEVTVPALDPRHEEGIVRAVKACLIHHTLLNAPEIETVVNGAAEAHAG